MAPNVGEKCSSNPIVNRRELHGRLCVASDYQQSDQNPHSGAIGDGARLRSSSCRTASLDLAPLTLAVKGVLVLRAGIATAHQSGNGEEPIADAFVAAALTRSPRKLVLVMVWRTAYNGTAAVNRAQLRNRSHLYYPRPNRGGQS